MDQFIDRMLKNIEIKSISIRNIKLKTKTYKKHNILQSNLVLNIENQYFSFSYNYLCMYLEKKIC